MTALHPVLTGQEPGYSNVVLSALEQQLKAATTPFVLVLDDVHLITDPAAVRMLALVVSSIPAGSQVAFTTRTDPPIAIGRLRAEGRILEADIADLALDRREARILLAGTGLASDAMEAVIESAEGWPVGVYLSAMALRSSPGLLRGATPAHSVPGPGALAVIGNERVVVDYLRSELWADLDESTMRFLTRTSILTELNGPLCDAVLADRGSGTRLRELRSTNLLVIPLDSQDQRYRYHHLLLDALGAELVRRESDLIPVLHDRTSRWFEANGDAEAAIRHAKLGGDLTRTAELIWTNIRLALGNGPLDTLRRWLDGHPDVDIARLPELMSASAWAAMLDHDLESMNRWLVLGQAGVDAPAFDAGGNPQHRREVRASIELLRALRGDRGFVGIGEVGEATVAQLAPLSAWRPFAFFMIGIGHLLTGNSADAVGPLREAEALAAGLGGHLVRADCLATLGLLAIENGHWDEGAALVLQSRDVLHRNGIRDLSTSAYSMSVVAMVQSRGSDAATARATVAHARRLTAEMSSLTPWVQVMGRVLQATASIHLHDVATARLLTREARQLLDSGPPSDFLAGFVERAELALVGLPADPAIGVTPLTTAELRVLQYLPTQLSFPEIAGVLFVSRHTIKTQALAIYRKLGVSSRTAAVERARRLGLLPALSAVHPN